MRIFVGKKMFDSADQPIVIQIDKKAQETIGAMKPEEYYYIEFMPKDANFKVELLEKAKSYD